MVTASFSPSSNFKGRREEPLQGDPEKGAVVIRFPSEQAVRDFVNDPEYQPVKEIRIALTTNANAVLASEFQMPEG